MSISQTNVNTNLDFNVQTPKTKIVFFNPCRRMSGSSHDCHDILDKR